MRYILPFLWCKNVRAFQKWPEIFFPSLDAMCVFVKILTNYAAPGSSGTSQILERARRVVSFEALKCLVGFTPDLATKHQNQWISKSILYVYKCPFFILTDRTGSFFLFTRTTLLQFQSFKIRLPTFLSCIKFFYRRILMFWIWQKVGRVVT